MLMDLRWARILFELSVSEGGGPGMEKSITIDAQAGQARMRHLAYPHEAMNCLDPVGYTGGKTRRHTEILS